jgi:hypothetical protein
VNETLATRSDECRRRVIKNTMMWTDLGFLTYWVITALGLVSVGSSRLLQQWNWSFIGLDLAAILLGLVSLVLARRRHPVAERLMVISLALTSAAGLMALNFYVIRGQFDLEWWIPNLWLFLFPAVAIALLPVRRGGGPTRARP